MLFEECISEAGFKLWDGSGEFLTVPSTAIEYLLSMKEPYETTDLVKERVLQCRTEGG